MKAYGGVDNETGKFVQWCDDHHLIVKREEIIFDVFDIWGIILHYWSITQQPLYFMRRLRMFGAGQRVLMLFYHAVMESALRNGSLVCNMPVKVKSQIDWSTQQ